MPIADEVTLKTLLTEEKVTAISIDTSIFVGAGLNFSSGIMKAVTNLHDIPFKFILSSTVFLETKNRLLKEFTSARSATDRAVSDGLFRATGSAEKKEEIMAAIFGEQPPAQAAENVINAFIQKSKCELLEDTKLVDTETIYNLYFNQVPPFKNKKKTEFPDALALKALERAAIEQNTAFLIVSQDSDWQDFCENSPHLYILNELKKALALINNTPAAARRSLMLWMSDDIGRAEIREKICEHAEDIAVDASANPSSGQVEITPWSPEVNSIRWPIENEIDLIETIELSPGIFRVVASFALTIDFFLSFDLDFSVWDSVDKEAISMGGRSLIVEHSDHMNVTLSVEIRTTEDDQRAVVLKEIEFDLSYLDIDLGDVDVFRDESYDDE